MVDKIHVLSVATLLFTIPALISAASPDEWMGRTIYQVLTDRFDTFPSGNQACNDLGNYCGGSFKGIENRLDYIQDLGFDAIWISPIVSQYDNGYHGYWAKNLSEINPHFGTANDLHSLVQAAHSRDMYIMVDVVANHMGCSGCQSFPNTFPFSDPSHYHSYCIIQDWSNQQQVEYCRLAGLPDLDQSNPYVRSTLINWVKSIVQTYQLDGIRIDTIPEVDPTFWDAFTAATGVYCTGEVFNGNLNYVQPYEPHVGSLLNYPLFFTLRNVFMSTNSMTVIESDYYKRMGQWKRVDLNPVFLDNHDNARFLSSQRDWTRYKNALSFVLGSTIPIIYYGSEQGYSGGNDPGCRESLWPNFNQGGDLYKHIKLTNMMRANFTSDLKQPFVQRYVDSSFYGYSRGKVLVVTTNVGQGAGDVTRTLSYIPYAAGELVCNIYYASDCVKVTQAGLSVILKNGEPKIFIPANRQSILALTPQGSVANSLSPEQ